MNSHRFHFFIAALVCAPALMCAQSSSKSVSIPEFPGAATAPASPRAPVQQPSQTSEPQAPALAVSPRVEAVPAFSSKKPLSKAEEKALRKKEREAEKKAKEAEAEKSFLKMQGDDLVAPTLDADGNPIHLAPCSKKDKVCQKKRKALLKGKGKKLGMKIENGTLTVDGWTGKARLNYDISEMKFLYIFSPGIGTTIISNQNFPGAKEEKNALAGKTMTVSTSDGHVLQLSSDEPLMGSEKKTMSMWVTTDAAYSPGSRYPSFGYGSTAKAPYNWPGTRPLTEKEQEMFAKAPPLPRDMVAKQMELPCVNVRPGEPIKPVKLNGITYTPKPCPRGTPGAIASGERPLDGSGAASTGVPDKAVTRRKD